MAGPRESREAQEGARGEGREGKGHSQALPLSFLLAFSLTLVAFMPVIWPMPLQRLLGHPLAQYVIWLRCRGLSVGLDVFGSLVPMAAAALLAAVLRARGLRALLPFAAKGVSVARLLAYAAASLLATGAMLSLASPSAAALLAVRGSATMAAVLALCLVYAVPVVAAMQAMRPRGQPLHLLAEEAGPGWPRRPTSRPWPSRSSQTPLPYCFPVWPSSGASFPGRPTWCTAGMGRPTALC